MEGSIYLHGAPKCLDLERRVLDPTEARDCHTAVLNLVELDNTGRRMGRFTIFADSPADLRRLAEETAKLAEELDAKQASR